MCVCTVKQLHMLKKSGKEREDWKKVAERREKKLDAGD